MYCSRFTEPEKNINKYILIYYNIFFVLNVELKNYHITRKKYTYITKLAFDLHRFVVIRCKTSWVEAPSFTYKASIFRGYLKGCPSY